MLGKIQVFKEYRSQQCKKFWKALHVTSLLNLSLRSGRIPTEWKESSVVPIPKTSSATSPNNYRPISLLSIPSKVLEHHVYTIIMQHLEDYNPLADSQWGFQLGKSTVSALLTTTHSCLRTLERWRYWNSIFVRHLTQSPMKRLQQIGLSAHILSWISDYLTSRFLTYLHHLS